MLIEILTIEFLRAFLLVREVDLQGANFLHWMGQQFERLETLTGWGCTWDELNKATGGLAEDIARWNALPQLDAEREARSALADTCIRDHIARHEARMVIKARKLLDREGLEPFSATLPE